MLCFLGAFYHPHSLPMQARYCQAALAILSLMVAYATSTDILWSDFTVFHGELIRIIDLDKQIFSA